MAEQNENRAQPRLAASGGRREAPRERKSSGKSKRRRKRPIGVTILVRFFQVIGTLLLIGVVTGAFLACYAAVYIKTAIIPQATLDLSAYTLNENSVIYYQDSETGEWVELQTLVGDENREWVDFDQIPEDLIHAFVAIEDKRFWTHQGVDWYRTAGAFVNMFLGMRNTFGGSTMTQQLVKNITEYNDVTVKRKILEIFTALDLENNHTKEEILTYYFNEIYFGNGCYGVQAASQFYFGKDVSELDLAECASLAGITNNPSLYSPLGIVEVMHYTCRECGNDSLNRDEVCGQCGAENSYGAGVLWTNRDYNKARQKTILRTMADPEISDQGAYISEAERDRAIAQELVFRWDRQADPDDEDGDATSTVDSTIYSWYVDAVISEVIADLKELTGLSTEVVTKMVYSGGLRIYVPFDPKVQAAVDAIYTDTSNLNYVSKTGQQMTSAITVVDNSTGYVVAMAGGIGEKTSRRGWNNALARQQPGSSIKPLSVYSPALEMNLITPATVSDDNPRELNGRIWPLNVSANYRGLTTIMYGVVQSLNTISVNTLEMVTPEISYQFMTEKYGFTSLVDRLEINGEIKSDIHVSPLAMGGLTYGLSTFEMAAAYATFPRNGYFTEATTYLRVEDIDGRLLLNNVPESKYIIKASTAYYINYLLTNAVNSGTGYYARINGQTVAGKTGTTNEVYDLWFAGYTPYYTAVVWTGYPYDEYIALSGNPSVTLWQKVMTILHQDLPNKGFPEPDDLTDYTVCIDCGLLATSDCENDLRGNHAQTFRLVRGDGPTEYCTCHVPVMICTDSPIIDVNGNAIGAYHLAGEFCPEESVREVTMVEYSRTLVRDDLRVGDYYALMTIYDQQMNPYCYTHTEGDLPPDDPDPGVSDDPWVSDYPGPNWPDNPVISLPPLVEPSEDPDPSPPPLVDPDPEESVVLPPIVGE